MTLARAAVAVRRRWWIALVGVVLTLAACVLVKDAPGVYYQQADVVLMWPQPPQNKENTFQYGNKTLIKTAGVVARAVQGHEGAMTVSDTATLAGQGIRHGWSVRLPNSGGQWAYDFEEPVLSVEAVGTTPREASATTTVVVSRINAELASLQRAEGVPSWLMIRTRLSPPTPVLHYAAGSRGRAVLMTLFIGVTFTLTAVRLVDRRLRRQEGGRPTPDAEPHSRTLAAA